MPISSLAAETQVGGWTTVDGERVKDDGLLEKFGVTLEEAQDLIMTARVILGWVNPDEISPVNSAVAIPASSVML